MSYTFIKENQFGRNEAAPILAIIHEIETLRVSETYDHSGQIVGTYITGDSIELLSEKAVEIAQKVVDEQAAEYELKVGYIINGYDNSDIFNEVWQSVTDNCIENEDYAEYYQTCKGFDYWDGSNWKTATVEAELGETSHEIFIGGGEDMNREIDESELVKEGYGIRVYESENYWIVESFYSGAFERYALYPKEDFELNQLI